MYIVRVQTEENKEQPTVRTFTFETEKDMDRAVFLLKQTPSRGFSATVKNADDTRGQIKDRWNRSNRYNSSLTSTVQYGAYKDSISETYGLKDECAAEVERTNAKATCWASKKAILKHVVGNLYKVTYISPFTD